MLTKKNSINLLYRDSGLSQTARTLRHWSLVAVGVYCVGLLGIFVATLILGFFRQSLIGKNDLLAQEINKYRVQEGLFLTVKNRIELTRALHSQNKPVPTDVIKQLALDLDPGVTLRNIQSEENTKITIFVSADNSLSLANFVNRLRNRELSYFELNNISLSQEGGYAVRLTLR